MAQKPMSEMSHKPGRMSEDADYILTEMKSAMQVLSEKMEKALTLQDIQPIMKELDKFTKQSDFMELVQHYNKKVVDQPCTNELAAAVNALSGKIDSLKDALLALTQKIDSEDVTNLDTDYEAIVSNILT